MRTGAVGVPGVVAALAIALAAAPPAPAADLLTVPGTTGRSGGVLLYPQRTAPKTLNPATASDSASREILGCITADLVHINRATQRTEASLAKSWSVSRDGLHYTLELRHGIAFSDGHPFDADDVVFSFAVYLDPQIASRQRDFLVIDGKPIVFRKLDSYRVAVDLPAPYAAAERLFDGFAMLPKHKLERAWRDGKLRDAWGLGTAPAEVAGLGPFRFKAYTPGQRVALERNPYYWKTDEAGKQLPYLEGVDFTVAGSEDTQVLRFQSGEADVISRVGARNFAALEKGKARAGYELLDAGPGLEYSFLFFNLNDLPASASRELKSRQAFFQRTAFRQAVSRAIDREAIARLVYLGRATPLSTPVPAGDRQWLNQALPRSRRDVAEARRILAEDRFTWAADGALLDPGGARVEFSIATTAGNTDRVQMATMIQDDLKALGMTVYVAPLEFAGLTARVTETRDFEACLMTLAAPDADPNPAMPIWLSSGGFHLWRPEQKKPATPWEAEIDGLMRRQISTLDPAARKRMYDRVQEIAMQNLPLIPLVTPHVLAGAGPRLANLRPAVMDHYVLWSVETLSLKR